MVEAAGLRLDYSRQRVTDETLALLLRLAEERRLGDWIEDLFAGRPVNNTERRPALHVALRRPTPGPFPPPPAPDVMAAVEEVRDRMRRLDEAVTAGELRGFDGQPIRAVVNLGIGGSDLPAKTAVEALSPYRRHGFEPRFVSNLDAGQLLAALEDLDPATTLLVVSSKSFTTPEALINARSARAWLVEAAGSATAAAGQLFAVTARPEFAAEFGVPRDNVFEMWDWVGGRYSVWSAIGLPLVLAVGMDRFEEFLAGAAAMDEHFRTAPSGANLPVLMALLGVWNRNFLGAATHAVLPYDWALRSFVDYLQQLMMESNGKRVTRDGEPIGYATSPVVWGSLANNGQHAYFQLLHQGTELVPADFLVPLHGQRELPGHHEAVLANALAQVEALTRGRTADEVRHAQAAAGASEAEDEALIAHRVQPGNRPVNVLLYDRLDPHILGALMALYEHRTFVQAVIWGINPFDQWGVELGKKIADRLLPALFSEPAAALTARGGSRSGRLASAAGPDARRRDAGNAEPLSRSGNAADGLAPPPGGRADFHHGLLEKVAPEGGPEEELLAWVRARRSG